MIPAIVLAAGRSRRMGRPKPSLPLPGGRTFLQRIVGTLTDAGVECVYVVLAADAPDLARNERDLAGLAAARIVLNPDSDRGQLSSLQCALDAIGAGPEAVLVTLVDLPMIAADTVRRLVMAFRESGAAIVRPTRGDAHGHPILVAREVIAALAAGDPDVGARPILLRYAHRTLDVPVEDEGAFTDIDTPDALEKLLAAYHCDE